ncbi:MAG TPA: 1,4-alpha-glucan branching protein GlgB [Bryobacteraceae bacterium]|nr:1,4-alpha-glucan branching protein GlgB [Bryobacteraceae bacterium]
MAAINRRFPTEKDLYLFREGTHTCLPAILGGHFDRERGGTHFAVWAPNARSVSVIGWFNDWSKDAAPLSAADGGIWQGFVPGAFPGAHYKFYVVGAAGYRASKADPFGVFQDTPPSYDSIIWDLDYQWNDQAWMSSRQDANSLNAPMSIYEVHLGSWRRASGENNRLLTYLELADQLIPYVKETGFTHVEFMPVMEHPFFGSWGYQTTGYFAPTSRMGTPQEFMQLIDRFHQNGIGVILDWVPSHFPQDEHGIGYFDGIHEYEPADPRRGIHPDWNSFIFDYGRGEVRSFLLSSALFWLSQYHADGLRVDAVASMLYLDYSRKPGEWVPNRRGGRENLEAIQFLRRMNEDIYRAEPGVQTIAEESTAWPMVSKPTYAGGLGFGFKWDMGWMHDTLAYMSTDPLYRRFSHHQLIFRSVYAFSENFILPLSHDEVVHGKGSLIGKMPGDVAHKFANLRLLLAYLYAQPGKKLLFMGCEFGQWSEWAHDRGLDWQLLAIEAHAGIRLLVGDLNRLYRLEAALHAGEYLPACFEWLNPDDAENNVISFLRKDPSGNEAIAVVCNFSAVPRANYRLPAPAGGFWKELLNTDAKAYGGAGYGNLGGIKTAPVSARDRTHSLTIMLPSLSVVFFKRVAFTA